MKIRKIVFFLLLAFLIVGCATPKAVKQLSHEIVEVNVQYHESLTAYFAIIEKFVDSQIQVATFLLKEADDKIEKTQKKRAELLLKEPNAPISKILSDFEKSIKDNSAESSNNLNELTKLNNDLKAKNKELLSIQSTIIAAQRKLDEYVQLEKADEAVVNELMGVVGGQLGKLTSTMGDITGIYDDISGILKK